MIAADTTVDLAGEIFGKPEDDDDARRMLRRLSGRDHEVHTGIALAVARSPGLHRGDDRRVDGDDQ